MSDVSNICSGFNGNMPSDPLVQGEVCAKRAIQAAQARDDRGVLVVAISNAERRGGLFADGFLDVVAGAAIAFR